jgi:hypothetical protein
MMPGIYVLNWKSSYPEKNHLILIILQCNTEHKNVFLHIHGLKIAQIKIPRNVVDNFGTLKTSSLKRKVQASFGFVYASILIKFNSSRHNSNRINVCRFRAF